LKLVTQRKTSRPCLEPDRDGDITVVLPGDRRHADSRPPDSEKDRARTKARNRSMTEYFAPVEPLGD
jgi:hypothetical protein